MRPRADDLDAPGLEWRGRKDGSRVPYWRARKSIAAQGYEPRVVRLHCQPANAIAIAQRCRELQAEMLEWAAQKGKRKDRRRFEGTLASLLDLYQTDPESPYQELKYNTRATYDNWITVLRSSVGARRLDALSGEDFRRWYRKLKEPRQNGGQERVRRAHACMATLRVIFGYGKVLGIPHCDRLKSILSELRFRNISPRRQRMTYAWTVAFMAKADEVGHPEMALAQAIQFELTLRQRDVIGEWLPDGHSRRWANGLTWNHISPDLILEKQTTKTGAHAAFDLKEYPLVRARIEQIPSEAQIGPVILNPSTGLPYKRRAYAERWREIARLAGIPDDVWNMDSRAGGITEGSDAGADLEHLRHVATHTNTATTAIYSRRTLEKTTTVARLRVAHRNKQ